MSKAETVSSESSARQRQQVQDAGSSTSPAPQKPKSKKTRFLPWLALACVIAVGGAAAGYVAWKQYQASALPAGIISVNGRVEATQVDISTKIPGRVIEIVPHEGDTVSPGQVVARIDTSETAAQLHQAQASAELARQTLTTRLAEVASDQAQLDFANQQMARAAALARVP
jgi:HlyD family secretion protein